MLVLGTRDTLLMGMGLAVKIGKKVGSSKWEKSLVFGKFDNASHDPLDSASDPLLVTLLPPRYQQLCKWLHTGFTKLSRPRNLLYGLVLGGPPDLLPTLLAVYLTATTG